MKKDPKIAIDWWETCTRHHPDDTDLKRKKYLQLSKSIFYGLVISKGKTENHIRVIRPMNCFLRSKATQTLDLALLPNVGRGKFG